MILVYLIERTEAGPVVVAKGEVGGEKAGVFIRSLVTPTVSAECEEGWKLWRWHMRRRFGRWQVNKQKLYKYEG
jgi:hypothetical protein